MKILRIIFYLFIYAVITFLWLTYDRRNILDKDEIKEILLLPAIWGFPILMILIGWIFGKLYSIPDKTKNRSFTFGQLTCIAIIFLFFIYTFISDRQHEKKFGNFEYNRATREYTYFPSDSPYQRRAFDALENNFSDKNSFRIVDLLSGHINVIIKSEKTDVFVSWFKYYLKNNPAKLLCAKYYVFSDTVFNEYINSDLKENLNFSFINRAYLDSLLRVAEKIK